MKKILFFCASLRGGGAERVISILSAHLCGSEAVEILLYYDAEIAYHIPEGIRIINVEKSCESVSLAVTFPWIRNYIRENVPDIIISFMEKFNMLMLAAACGTYIPVIVADRGNPRYSPKRYVMRSLRNLCYRRASAVVVQNHAHQVYFAERLKKEITVIANPVEMKEMSGKALRTPKENVIVSVGRLDEVKNQRMQILAFREVLRELPKYRFYIIGEGPLKVQLQELIREQGLEDRVILTGFRKEVHDMICSAKLFLMTSFHEGMPNSLIEAMCLGLPVISTNIDGIGEVITDGRDGILVPFQIDELARSIKRILKDEELQKRLGTEAVKRQKQFEVGKICDQWMELICKVTAV